jgi:hypothetical protein
MHGICRTLGELPATQSLFDEPTFERPAASRAANESGSIMTLDQYLTSIGL